MRRTEARFAPLIAAIGLLDQVEACGCRTLGRGRYVALEPADITVGADSAALGPRARRGAEASIRQGSST